MLMILFLFSVGLWWSHSQSCPENVETVIQSCIEESGLYDIKQTVGTVFIDGRIQTQFCRKGVKIAVTCVENVLKFCNNDREQKLLVQLLVDVQKLKSSFHYFCQNLHVFSSNKSCVVGLYHIPTCMDAVTRQNNQKPNSTHSDDVTMKLLMDNLCGLFDVISTCYTISFPSKCYMTSQLFLRLFSGARYPYCDLTEREKQFRLLNILNFSSNAPTISLNSCCLILSYLILFLIKVII